MQGNTAAQYKMGEMYVNAQGTLQNYVEAVRWYRLAAEQGFGQAQSALGGMYEKARGVRQDYVTAHMWFNLGTANGGWGYSLFTVEREMTPAAIEEAQRRARVCLASNYQDCD